MLPHTFGCWQTVYGYFNTWRKQGVFERVQQALTRKERKLREKPPPTRARALFAQECGNNAVCQFLFLRVAGGHARILPPASGLKLGHCRFILYEGLRCAYSEAVPGYSRHVYLGFGRHVLDHISRSSNTERVIAHFAVLINSPEQWPFTDARKTLILFNGLYGALLEIDFSPFAFLIGL